MCQFYSLLVKTHYQVFLGGLEGRGIEWMRVTQLSGFFYVKALLLDDFMFNLMVPIAAV
jgi:hypothetical protein